MRRETPASARGETRSTYERALDMLESRARATDELRRLLLRKGEPQPDVDDAIAKLVRAGLLDDANFARQFTRSKMLGAGQSRRRIKQELSRRGVTGEIAEAAIEAVVTDEAIDESASIDLVARKKLRTLTGVDAVVRKRRLYAFLARRGFDADDIQRTVRRLLLDNGGGPDE